MITFRTFTSKQAARDFRHENGTGDDDNSAFDICGEWFGLEPDYLDELI